MSYAFPYAASQLITTLLIMYVFSRSIISHASSAKFDDHLESSFPLPSAP